MTDPHSTPGPQIVAALARLISSGNFYEAREVAAVYGRELDDLEGTEPTSHALTHFVPGNVTDADRTYANQWLWFIERGDTAMADTFTDLDALASGLAAVALDARRRAVDDAGRAGRFIASDAYRPGRS